MYTQVNTHTHTHVYTLVLRFDCLCCVRVKLPLSSVVEHHTHTSVSLHPEEGGRKGREGGMVGMVGIGNPAPPSFCCMWHATKAKEEVNTTLVCMTIHLSI